MPLSDHEQRILEEIERRLAEEDPRLVEQVSRTSLYTHLLRRIRLAAFAFIAGFVLLLFGLVNTLVGLIGFATMLFSALLIYRYGKRMGQDQLRSMQRNGSGRFSLPAFLARLSGRFRGQQPPPPT
jgi:hypothetical protein